MQHKLAQLAATQWKDSRPLHAFFGDSQVELGQWYDLCEGSIAIRNCGLSRAKIEDVTNLVGAVPDRNVDTVLLMCGINNLSYDESVSSCIEKYTRLLAVARELLHPRRIAVVSVMPVRQSIADQRARTLNRNVLALNDELRTLCYRNGVIFIDINEAVTNPEGGLSERLTFDGLHLNFEGYKAIATVICKSLTQTQVLP